MMRKAPVHIWLPGAVEPVVAGEFQHDPIRRLGLFRYDQAYIDAGFPMLSPGLPVRNKESRMTGGHGIFPLFLDAGPDAWGRHLLAKRLGRDVDEFEALTLCPTDGVGNIALGELTAERMRVLGMEEFLAILAEIERGGAATSDLQEQVLDAVENGTSLGGTKPKLTISRDGVQYLAKFPERSDSRWLPHVECAMLRLAAECGIRACEAEVWRLPDGFRTALLVKRFDRTHLPNGTARLGYVSAHALLRLDMLQHTPDSVVQLGAMGFSTAAIKRSYLSFAADMARWCGGQAVHLEERRELWRRIVFNSLIRNLDDHPKNHGMCCENMTPHRWRLSPAFDLVPAAYLPQNPSLSMAYHLAAPDSRSKTPQPARLVTKVDRDDLVSAAIAHYGYKRDEATEWLQQTAARVAARWRDVMAEEEMPPAAVERFKTTFHFAAETAAALA